MVPEVFRGFDHLEMARDLGDDFALLAARVDGAGADASLGDWLERARPATDAMLAGLEPDPDAAALVLYTSGTTSAPKGAIHTHNTLRAEADGIEIVHECSDDDVIMLTMPIAHVGGMLYGVCSRPPSDFASCCSTPGAPPTPLRSRPTNT